MYIGYIWCIFHGYHGRMFLTVAVIGGWQRPGEAAPLADASECFTSLW